MAQQVFRLPLVPVPQRFTIKLAGRSYLVVCRWNGEEPAWNLDLFDADTDAPLILNLPLVTGADLFSQHRHLEIGGSLVVVTDGAPNIPPTLTNLGAEGNVYFVSEA